jgi:hypothetical protein
MSVETGVVRANLSPLPRTNCESAPQLFTTGFVTIRLIEASDRARRLQKVPRWPMSAPQMRRLWHTGLIRENHKASRETYRSRLVHAELIIGMNTTVSEKLVAYLMCNAGIRGLPDQQR